MKDYEIKAMTNAREALAAAIHTLRGQAVSVSTDYEMHRAVSSLENLTADLEHACPEIRKRQVDRIHLPGRHTNSNPESRKDCISQTNGTH